MRHFLFLFPLILLYVLLLGCMGMEFDPKSIKLFSDGDKNREPGMPVDVTVLKYDSIVQKKVDIEKCDSSTRPRGVCYAINDAAHLFHLVKTVPRLKFEFDMDAFKFNRLTLDGYALNALKEFIAPVSTDIYYRKSAEWIDQKPNPDLDDLKKFPCVEVRMLPSISVNEFNGEGRVLCQILPDTAVVVGDYAGITFTELADNVDCFATTALTGCSMYVFSMHRRIIIAHINADSQENSRKAARDLLTYLNIRDKGMLWTQQYIVEAAQYQVPKSTFWGFKSNIGWTFVYKVPGERMARQALKWRSIEGGLSAENVIDRDIPNYSSRRSILQMSMAMSLTGVESYSPYIPLSKFLMGGGSGCAELFQGMLSYGKCKDDLWSGDRYWKLMVFSNEAQPEVYLVMATKNIKSDQLFENCFVEEGFELKNCVKNFGRIKDARIDLVPRISRRRHEAILDLEIAPDNNFRGITRPCEKGMLSLFFPKKGTAELVYNCIAYALPQQMLMESDSPIYQI